MTNLLNNLNNYCLDYKDFSAHYKLIRKSKESQLGDIQLMKHKPTCKIVQVKEQSVDNEQDLNELLASLEQFLTYNFCEHFLAFLGFSIRQILLPFKPSKTSCPPGIKWSVYMIYEYIDNDLEKETFSKSKSGSLFPEIFIWKVLNSLIKCFETLQKSGRRYGDLRPSNVYYSKEDDIIKLLYTNYAKSSFDLILAKKIPYYKCFLAPEQLEMVGEKRFDEKGFDLIKCEIFSIATMLLSTFSYQNKDRIYNIHEPLLLYSGVNSKLSWLKANYSNVLSSLFEQMLSVNENLRPNLLELRAYINRNVKNQYNFGKLPSESTILKHHTTSNSFDSSNYEKNIIFDSVSLQRILNDSKSTKRTDKTTISNGSKEMIFFESKENSSLQRSMELKEEVLEIREKDLKSSDLERKIPFFEKIKAIELKKTPLHRRNVSEIPIKTKSYRSVQTFDNPFGNSENFLEEKQQGEEHIRKLIKKMEKKYLYEKNNPTVLKSTNEKINYSDGSFYMGMIKNGVREGQGLYYFSHQEVYGGDWKNDRFDGNGVYIYDNGDIYEGSLQMGLKEGKGIYHYANGNKYDGDWSNNMKNGFGVFYINTQEKFEGFWADNEKSGPGVYYFSTGDKFEGSWSKGKKSGKGLVYFCDSSVFEGFWEENQPQGHGVLHYTNGDSYEGSFLCGIKEGQGVYRHGTGCCYEGCWTNDERTGKGTLVYANGDRYQGEMLSGSRDGYGVYCYKTGERYEGNWKEDKRCGKGRLIIGGDSYYEGEWVQGKRDGSGLIVYANGEKYEGGWKWDRKEGKGIYWWKNGSVYNGNWKDDKMNGEGKYVDENGMEINGLWLNNEFWDK